MVTESTRVQSSLGIYSTNGSSGFSVARDPLNKGFFPFPADTVVAFTGSATLTATHAGALTVSGTAGVCTLTLPLAVSSSGMWVVVRNLSADAHIITCSQETAGTKAICNPPWATGTGQGSKITFPATIKTSVTLVCDGANWTVSTSSGSFAISGT